MEDQRNILFEEKPFSYKFVSKEKKAIVKYKDKDVTVIAGKDFNKLERVIALDNVYELQLFLVKVTGHLSTGLSTRRHPRPRGAKRYAAVGRPRKAT